MRLSLLLGQLEFFWGKVSQLSRQFYPVQSECMESAHTQLWGQGWGREGACCKAAWTQIRVSGQCLLGLLFYTWFWGFV